MIVIVANSTVRMLAPAIPGLVFRLAGWTAPLGPISVSAHFLFESLAYAVGFAVYRRQRRQRGDVLSRPNRNSVIAAAIVGAAIGSKLLGALEDPAAWVHGTWPIVLGGKTIVGALLGGTLAVEWAKRRLGIQNRTGDLFAVPLAVGIAVGRLGCFLGGMEDHTYGTPTNLPWAVDFGDGIPRHPVQLYESAFVLVLALALSRLRRSGVKNGDLYRIFLFSYLAWRLVVDFLKPEPAWAGLSTIQWICAAALVWYARDIARIVSARRKLAAHG